MSREVALATHLVGPLSVNIFAVTETDEKLSSIKRNAEASLSAQRGATSWSFLTSLLRNTAGSTPFNFVSEVDGITVGFALGYIIDTRCVITSLFVEEKCRSLGIGKLLLTCAQQFNAAAKETLVCVLPGQRELKNLCEQAGLPAQLIFAGTP
ncbi:MAG: GNAT family N-acetyltransferase [Actinobacteria bacterium]|jgi:ribosomal protein S18 acetylase RimI-like enzyme|nr:GNAT family N-acetyltransferase [Actinomycetota bacterium]